MKQTISAELFKVLSFAREESVYYQDKLKNLVDMENLDYDNFALLPELTRNDLCDNRDKILCLKYHNLRKKELDLVLTSGSTGQFVEVYWDKTDYLRSNLPLWRKRIEWYGIHPYHHRAEFSIMTAIGSTRVSSEKIRMNRNVLELSILYMDKSNLIQYYNAMRDNNIVWIYSTIGAMLIFTSFCIENKLPKIESLKYIELYGEYVSPASLEMLKKYFSIPVSIMYGAKEVNGIALQCPQGHMHVIDDNVFVEKNNESIYITSLQNHAFPIIRYKIGDVFDIEKCSCEYGKGLVITNFIGREKQLSFLDVHSGITVKALTSIIYAINALFKYCFLQYNIEFRNGGNYFEITIVIPKEKNTWAEQIRNEFESRINQISPFHLVPINITNIPLSLNCKTGKTNAVTILDSNVRCL